MCVPLQSLCADSKYVAYEVSLLALFITYLYYYYKSLLLSLLALYKLSTCEIWVFRGGGYDVLEFGTAQTCQ
jgi:hypothetical protein